MAVIRNTAEGGSNTTAVTTGNSGGASGDAFAVVSIVGSATITFSNEQAEGGSLSYKMNTNGTDAQYLQWLPTTSNAAAFRGYFYFPALPSSGNGIVQIRSSGGGTTHTQVVLRNDGSFQVSDATGGFPFTSAAAVIPTATWLRLEIGVTNPSTTTGTLNLNWYVGDSSTPISGSTVALTGANFATTGMGQVRVGRAAPFGTFSSFYVDSLAWQDGSNTFIGPTTNTPPTVSAGLDQNLGAAVTANLSGTVSDAEGTATVLWSYDFPTSGAPTLNNPTTLTPNFTTGALGSLYILRNTATDNDGATAFDSVEVRVPVLGSTPQRAVPMNGSGTGVWTIAGGSATDGAALSDESDTTYIESPAVSASEVNRRIRLVPGTAKSTAQIKVKIWTDTGNATITVRLYEGATLRQTFSTFTAATGITEFTLNLSAGTISAISDWGNLYVEVGAVA